MSSQKIQNLHIIFSVVTSITAFLMRENLTSINLSFRHESLLVSIIALYFAARFFTVGQIELFIALFVTCSCWLYVWMFADRDFRWSNCILGTTWIFIASSFFLLKKHIKKYSLEDFFSLSIFFMIAMIALINSVSSIIFSDTNEMPGLISVSSGGREPIEVGEEWVDAKSYNKNLLGIGFTSFIVGVVFAKIGIQSLKQIISEKRKES